MTRAVLAEERIDPAIRDKISTHNRDLVEEVEAAVAAHDVVVVGMKQNAHPKHARKALEAHGVPFHYLEYGSYLSMWRRRLALKLWTGWPTFPMVFVKGVLVGGADDLQKLIDSGELDRRLGRAAKPAT